ncbi:MAG: tetratricopeptide repeat protein, partial [Nitrospirota bacterium]
MSTPHIRKGWYRMNRLAMVLFLLTCIPWLAEAGVQDRWQTLTDAGTTARDQAQYEDAERLFLLARHEAEQFEPGDTRVAATLNHLGLVYHAQGQYGRAKPYYEQALALWERIHGTNHVDVASALNNLAEIYQEEGAFEQAEAAYLRSLTIGERALGRGHPELAIGFNNLARLYRKQGRLVQAESRFRLALALLASADGDT